MEHRREEEEEEATRFSGEDGNGILLPDSAAASAASAAGYADNARSTHQQHTQVMGTAREFAMPRIVELAERLVPVAARELERGLHVSQGGSLTSGSVDGRINTDNEESQENSNNHDIEVGLSLPRDVALAAAGHFSLDWESSPIDDVVPVDVIAASLDSDVALLDLEADALLESIRSTSMRNAEGGHGGAVGLRDDNNDDDDNISTISLSTNEDDDGMGGEIRRLGQVVASLRRDLAGAQGSIQIPLGDEDGSGSDSSRRANRGEATNYLAQQLQSYKYFGLRSDGITSGSQHAALIWAVALVWALIILLSAHVQLGSDIGGGASWIDVVCSFFS